MNFLFAFLSIVWSSLQWPQRTAFRPITLQCQYLTVRKILLKILLLIISPLCVQ